MGRTLPTFNAWLEEERESWRGFRRALRREDREAFDRLFSQAKSHMAEAAAAARPLPFESFLISVLLEQQKTLARLEAELARVRADPPSPSAASAPAPPPPSASDGSFKFPPPSDR